MSFKTANELGTIQHAVMDDFVGGRLGGAIQRSYLGRAMRLWHCVLLCTLIYEKVYGRIRGMIWIAASLRLILRLVKIL